MASLKSWLMERQLWCGWWVQTQTDTRLNGNRVVFKLDGQGYGVSQRVRHDACPACNGDQLSHEFGVCMTRRDRHRDRNKPLGCSLNRSADRNPNVGHVCLACPHCGEKVTHKTAAQGEEKVLTTQGTAVLTTFGHRPIDKNGVGS